jgi:hypothetical protein
MGFAGYVSVCVQLYCVGFHCFTTCFGLHGHLQVCRIFLFSYASKILLRCFFCLFFTWSHSACFHLCFFSSVFLHYFCCFLLCLSACSVFVVCLSSALLIVRIGYGEGPAECNSMTQSQIAPSVPNTV